MVVVVVVVVVVLGGSGSGRSGVGVGSVGSVRYTCTFMINFLGVEKCDSKSGSGNREGKHHIYVKQQT